MTQWLGLYVSLPRVQVQSLVWELRSCKLCGQKKKKNEDEIYTNIEILCCIFETNIRLYVICTSIYLFYFIFSVHQFKKEPLQRKNEGYW